jgi:TolB protein
MRVICGISLALLLAAPAAAQDRPHFDLEVRRTGAERLVLSLAPPRLESSVGEGATANLDLAHRLVTDLVYSGLFAFKLPLPDGVARPPYVPEVWEASEDRDAIAEIQLVLSGIRADEMVWTVRVVDARTRGQLLGRRYVLDLGSPERQVHHLADSIVRELTGDDGIAQTRILFSRETGPGVREIFVVDYDGRNLRQITRNGSLNLLPRWSHDGERICYTSYWQGRQRLLVLDGRSGESRKVAEFTGLNFGADWAPGDEELAVTLTRDGNPEIYRIALDGSIRARLTFSPAIDCSAIFDPTGNQIAFTSDRTGAPQLFRMSRDGTDRIRLTWEGSYNDNPDWSPNGDRIAYVSRREGQFRIFTVDADGSNLQPITLAADGNNEDCSWAPDGRHLVVTSDRDRSRRLWVIDTETGWARPLTEGAVDDNGPHWSGPPGSGSNQR